MSKRGVHLLLAIALMAFVVGNPGVKAGASHTVVGAWHMDLDATCDQSSIESFLLLFFSNGTAELIFGTEFPLIIGTWSLSGDSITFEISSFATFTGTVTSNSVSDGTFASASPPVDGCWTATKTEF